MQRNIFLKKVNDGLAKERLYLYYKPIEDIKCPPVDPFEKNIYEHFKLAIWKLNEKYFNGKLSSSDSAEDIAAAYCKVFERTQIELLVFKINKLVPELKKTIDSLEIGSQAVINTLIVEIDNIATSHVKHRAKTDNLAEVQRAYTQAFNKAQKATSANKMDSKPTSPISELFKTGLLIITEISSFLWSSITFKKPSIKLLKSNLTNTLTNYTSNTSPRLPEFNSALHFIASAERPLNTDGFVVLPQAFLASPEDKKGYSSPRPP